VMPGRLPGAFGHFTPGPPHGRPVAGSACACLDLGVSAGQIGPSGQYG
jgi:hypothetical protein